LLQQPEIVSLTAANCSLTKRIGLNGGALKIEPVAQMTHGTAARVPLADVGELGAFISSLKGNQALALGQLKPGLPATVDVVTKQRLRLVNAPNCIARSAEYIMAKSKTSTERHCYVLAA
jgi:hypothetical protein